MKLPDRKLIIEINYDDDEGLDVVTLRLAWITTVVRVGNPDNYRQWQNLWSMNQEKIIGRFKIESLKND